MIPKEYRKLISELCQTLFSATVDIELDRPEPQFGDYSSNVAMKLASQLDKAPRDIALQLANELKKYGEFSEVNVAGPGFINIKLSDEILFDQSSRATKLPKPLNGQSIVMEYSDPNPFKALHAGHLYTTLVGDATSNFLEAAGAKVVRTNFGGDVGLHAAKAMWGILKELGGEKPENLSQVEKSKRSEWISDCYVLGNRAFESDDGATPEITLINQRIYNLHAEEDKNSPFAQIYWTCRQWSYDGFEKLYETLKITKFDKFYPESATVQIGLEKVRQNTGKVYEESNGATIFRGEKYGLFTQVFATKDGLPTYAGKDVGLIFLKENDYKPDVSYIITDSSQKDHLAVVMKSIERFEPDLVKKTIHKTHGRITLPGGKKMSSRAGDVVLASDVIEAAKASAKGDQEDVVLGAVRYSFLKNRVGGNIVYDPVESVSHEGNSGPYLQYALVRARSILRKLGEASKSASKIDELDQSERALARQLTMYPEVFEAALNEYSPHHVCNYLYELAQIFNRFYENSRVSGDPREALRTELVHSYEKVLSHGLTLLGMPKPEQM